MSGLLSNDWFLFPAFGFCVFLFSYLMCDRFMAYLYKKSLGSREEILRLMDMMFMDADKRRVTLLLLLISFGLGFLVFLAFWPSIVAGLLFGSLITIVGWSLPKLVITNLWESRCNRLVDQLVDGMTIMANGIKAGLSVPQSMERVTENIRGPLAQEFKLVLNKLRLGLSIEDALNELGERIPRPDVQMFVTAVNILKETGGNLAETFTTIVTVVRERQKVEKKIQAMTAQGLMQGIIISLAPFILMIIFLVADPAYMLPMFTRPLGWFFLCLMVGLVVIGGLMIKKIVTIKI